MGSSIWRTIRRWARAIGDFQARLLLTLLYGLLVIPTGAIARLGGDLLDGARHPAGTYWRPRGGEESRMRDLRRQG